MRLDISDRSAHNGSANPFTLSNAIGCHETSIGGSTDRNAVANNPLNLQLLHDGQMLQIEGDRKSTRLNSSHVRISYAVFCLKKKNKKSTSCQTMILVCRDRSVWTA